jgi:hypothetical protein
MKRRRSLKDLGIGGAEIVGAGLGVVAFCLGVMSLWGFVVDGWVLIWRLVF